MPCFKCILALCFSLILFISCQNPQGNVQNQSPTQTVTVIQTKEPNRKPVINNLDVNPNSITGPDDSMTFTINTYDPDGDSLNYEWSATKGMLSANKGLTVSWSPKKSNGDIDTGLATITVIVDDNNGGTVSGSINIKIEENGSAGKQ